MNTSRDRMLIRLPEVYDKGVNSNVSKLLTLPSEQIDEVAKTLDKVGLWRDVDLAGGLPLDNIGSNVAQRRGEAVDSVYRILIKTKILRSQSDGSVPAIINSLVIAFDIDPKDVTVQSKWDVEPGSVFITVPWNILAGVGLSVPQFGTLCQSLVAAGVRAVPMTMGTFSFSSQNNVSEYDNEAGFNSVGGNTGGFFGGTYDPAEDKDLPI